MNKQEIRERLDRYNKARMDGDLRVGVPDVGAFADWMAEELGRQLDRNHKLDKQLTGMARAGKFIGLYVEYLNEQEIEDHCDIILNPGGNEILVTVGAFRRLAQALKGVNLSICQWVLDEDGVYQTSCDEAWELMCGDLSDNKVKFCPYCGGQIKEVKDE